MIRSMEVSSPNPLAPVLPIGTIASDDPVQIRDIKGLEPVKADMSSTALATGRGEYFQGSSTPTRNIVLVLGLNPNWLDQTIASLRKLLYAYFMPELRTKLRFVSDDYPVVDIEGIVETFEPNIFSQDPEMTISIICHSPDFIDPDPVVIKGVVTNALVDGLPNEYEIAYDGTAPTDFLLWVKTSPTKESYDGRLVIVNETYLAYEVFDVDPIELDDTKRFRLSTLKTRRRVATVYSEGEDTNLLKKMTPNSRWMELKPGQNVFAVSAEESGLIFELTYYNRFGGL